MKNGYFAEGGGLSGGGGSNISVKRAAITEKMVKINTRQTNKNADCLRGQAVKAEVIWGRASRLLIIINVKG